MSVSSRVQELRRRHETLSREVENAQKKPGFDGLALVELKRRKLRLKEEINRLDS
ncbi:DUF465 domain-containing protein [Palleronia sediminis]|uniref:DUF465 domain-containing protein n=1 Tax=Palleronia sediminis TaxID=2547833 RepID=A0A4R5ZYQ0_9RHOB|nr:DUF465 domain-containing protein [Palleronia sediminis]TDL76351.1 DUF465 domain-containing protein [Palleronia sediminis]